MKLFQIERNKLNNQEGFTLVELLVVIAIIGILSAVAVPNFKKFKERAKMSEADVNMSTMYTGLIAHELDNNDYDATDLDTIGYSTSSKNIFAVGYADDDADKCDNDGATTGACSELTSADATTQVFTIHAVGQIQNDTCGITLDQDKERVATGTANNNTICK